MRLVPWIIISTLVAGIATAVPALAQTFVSGSTGADGAFSPTASVTLVVPPDGVFNFTTITIPSSVTVFFETRLDKETAAITWLATGNVTIAGTINLQGVAVVGNTRGGGGNGGSGARLFNNGGVAGPGGGHGGGGGLNSGGGGGRGPGGGGGGIKPEPAFTPPIGGVPPGGGGHLTPGVGGLGGAAYGTSGIVPLVGGSGGGGGHSPNTSVTGGGGGGGGGAILIASSGTISFTGTIDATGGAAGGGGFGANPGAGGSGGSVRFIATTMTGTGTLQLSGGSIGAVGSNAGAFGRVRVEAFNNTASLNGIGASNSLSVSRPTTVAAIGVALRIVAVGGVPAPALPGGSFTIPDVVLPTGTSNPVTVSLEAANIPPGTPITVQATPQTGGTFTTVSSPLAGTLAATTATASLDVSLSQPNVISASVSFTLTAAAGGEPVLVDGEVAERVRVTATLGGGSHVTYITRSGRELVGLAR